MIVHTTRYSRDSLRGVAHGLDGILKEMNQPSLEVFVSSVMNLEVDALAADRRAAIAGISAVDIAYPWAFEHSLHRPTKLPAIISAGWLSAIYSY